MSAPDGAFERTGGAEQARAALLSAPGGAFERTGGAEQARAAQTGPDRYIERQYGCFEGPRPAEAGRSSPKLAEAPKTRAKTPYPNANICIDMYMSVYMYLYALFALFSRFGQSMVDTLCLHNNTSN